MANCTFLPATFKRLLTLQTKTMTSDGQGGFTETWTNTANLWASIEPVKAYERFQAMQMQTPVSHKITMRYRSDVTTDSRILYDGRVFWVKEVINVNEENRYLAIKAIERA